MPYKLADNIVFNFLIVKVRHKIVAPHGHSFNSAISVYVQSHHGQNAPRGHLWFSQPAETVAAQTC